MPLSNVELKFAGIYRARVLSSCGNVASVLPENFNCEVNVTILSATGGRVTPLKIGAIGIILLQGNNTGVWLGYIDQGSDVAEEISSGANLNSPDNTASVRVERNNVVLGNQNFKLESTPQQLEITQNRSKLLLSNIKYQVLVNQDETGMMITTDAIYLENQNKLNLVGGRRVNICSRGPIILSGGINDTNETDEYRQLATATKIIGKAGEIKFNANSVFSLDAGKFHINLTSATIAGGQVPGSGGLDAFTLNIVQGNTLISSALGNIEMYAMGLPNYIALRSGAIFDVIYSELKLSRASASIKNMLSGINSSLNLKLGNAELSATRNIDINALMKTTISGKTGIELNSLTNIDLSALLNINIDAKVKIELKTAILDLKNAKLIDAGPKVVAPTGSGPFCAIPTCVISGVPHIGSQAVG